MGKTKIEWADFSFNAWIGCTRKSDGCVNCYAEAMMDTRLGKVQWGPQGTRYRTSRNNWAQPVRWNAYCGKHGIRQSVFCNSLSDVFEDHPSIAPEMRRALYDLWAETPQLDWLPLTKRPENWAELLPAIQPGERFKHVRLGTSIENDKVRPERAMMLRIISEIGWPTYISYEPALGPVDWSFLADLRDTWLICGGESGPNARPMHPDWARAARDACAQHDIPFFFKQWGEHLPLPGYTAEGEYLIPQDADVPSKIRRSHNLNGDQVWRRVGKKAAGRVLDGVEHSAFPAQLARAA